MRIVSNIQRRRQTTTRNHGSHGGSLTVDLCSRGKGFASIWSYVRLAAENDTTDVSDRIGTDFQKLVRTGADALTIRTGTGTHVTTALYFSFPAQSTLHRPSTLSIPWIKILSFGWPQFQFSYADSWKSRFAPLRCDEERYDLRQLIKPWTMQMNWLINTILNRMGYSNHQPVRFLINVDCGGRVKCYHKYFSTFAMLALDKKAYKKIRTGKAWYACNL